RPAGARMGLYFLEYATAPRPALILYDRRDSAMSRLQPEDVDWTRLRGARLLHLSGITPALGENLRQVLRRAVREAAAAGVPLSLDVNYRSRLWTPKEARDFLVEVVAAARHLLA